MARDYERVLEPAEELLTFTGYLDTDGLRQQTDARNKFIGAVNIFVYDLFRETPDHGALAFSVSADLDRIAAEGSHNEAAIAETRAALLEEIAARSRNSPAMRFFLRWGPDCARYRRLGGCRLFADPKAQMTLAPINAPRRSARGGGMELAR